MQNSEQPAWVGVRPGADGRVQARVWAPEASHLSVVLEGRNTEIALRRDDHGYFSGEAPGARVGDRYWLRRDDTLLADPASRFQPEGVQGPSQIVDSQFPWQHEAWPLPPRREWVIYELHVGSFTEEGTFAAIIPHLPYLRDLGVTAIELMPVAQFPGTRNWGYDGVFPYAVQHSYGGPDGLRDLVDAAHGLGMAVILDVVYNHMGPEGSVIHRFGPYFTDNYHTPWGDAINFDGPASDEVRAFFIQSALMFLEEFRIDGFRLDAIHQIYDCHAQPFLADLADAVHGRAADLGREALLIAESDLNDTRVIQPRERNGFGLDAQWADDFCHALETQLVGDASDYATDFAPFADLAAAMEQAFVYTGQYSQMRRRHFGKPPGDVRKDQFVVFMQNHDQVGNRPFGMRLGQRITFAQRKLAAATVLLSPFMPMLFMGEEYGEPNPFLYMTDHSDSGLVEAVREGRKSEFGHWDLGSDDAAPDPQAEETLIHSRVQVGLHRDDTLETAAEHQGLHATYRTLIALRRQFPVLTDPEAGRTVTALEPERILLLHGRNSEGETFAILHFADGPVTLDLPWPAGEWTRRFDASEARFHGRGASGPDLVTSGGTVTLRLPGHAALLYTRSLIPE
ncbi:MAG: malto-oligosyltrehalose trehalohydrolase [Chloroflexota bacterium]|nr:malto-oligosyltrehalose trehalohydrolase [Chloroflexota bacterium]